MEPEERAREGVFLAFQYPVEIPGVNNAYFLKAARQRHAQAPRASRSSTRWSSCSWCKEKMKLLQMDQSFLSRAVNEGFSGGEKKRNEIFQMAVLEPKLASSTRPTRASTSTRCKIVADGVNALRSARARDHRRHALPAPARLHRARLRARADATAGS